MYCEIEAQEKVVEQLLAGLANKNPKVPRSVVSCVSFSCCIVSCMVYFVVVLCQCRVVLCRVSVVSRQCRVSCLVLCILSCQPPPPR